MYFISKSHTSQSLTAKTSKRFKANSCAGHSFPWMYVLHIQRAFTKPPFDLKPMFAITLFCFHAYSCFDRHIYECKSCLHILMMRLILMYYALQRKGINSLQTVCIVLPVNEFKDKFTYLLLSSRVREATCCCDRIEIEVLQNCIIEALNT